MKKLHFGIFKIVPYIGTLRNMTSTSRLNNKGKIMSSNPKFVIKSSFYVIPLWKL
jgi:hypothetical protein